MEEKTVYSAGLIPRTAMVLFEELLLKESFAGFFSRLNKLDIPLPFNPITGLYYKGWNRLILGLDGLVKGFSDPRWMGKKQALSKGWKLKKNQQSSYIYIPLAKKSSSKGYPRYASRAVYNGEQFEDIDRSSFPFAFKEKGEDRLFKLGDALKLKVIEACIDKSCYLPAQDLIVLPPLSHFKSKFCFQLSLLHELAHATGHESRLHRRLGDNYRSYFYIVEEILAEFSTLLIFAKIHPGLQGRSLQEALEEDWGYLRHWIFLLGADNRSLRYAIFQGLRAFLYLEEKLLAIPL
ncbi:zincin-like metallopeptidase domain-containing protein [Candidatus Methylacidiphilum infernorum]|nr:zincin-like metallopeptidase domain-containing protein [Candidatus Methylacidiphilum infernorum]